MAPGTFETLVSAVRIADLFNLFPPGPNGGESRSCR